MIQRWLLHVACICALAWPAFLNGQPFFFPDTTSYVRAADSAAYIFSGHRISTEWTEHYRRALDPAAKRPEARGHVAAHGNDIASQSIMAGRSPYFGALLWMTFLFGSFWLFVIAQAVAAYWLVHLTLRMFDVLTRQALLATVSLLALGTSLPFFVGLLMPDLLAGFGMLAFLLMVIDRGRMRRWERTGVGALLLLSLLSHLTHIVAIGAMLVLLPVGMRLGGRPWPEWRGAFLTTLTLLAIGLASVVLTGAVVERVFGRRPLLVPLLTARFMADGPGLAYLRDHCDRPSFAACAWKDRSSVAAGEFLWSLDPARGGYMFADAQTRRAMSDQDSAFALAVLAEHPIAQGGRIAYNATRQMLRFEVDILNYHCAPGDRCWRSLPPRQRAALLSSLGGRNLWPQMLVARLQQAVVVISVLLLLAWSIRGRSSTQADRDLLLWIGLFMIGAMVNALLGGGVSEPQPRYQARIIWLIPLMASLAALLWRRSGQSGEKHG
ncbi:hypothetical protein [Rhizorhabdus sp. FW153]|uniref:hypothetical protein n=1 Tax=Rhizorhabdus sp. FW153 TaxID=3400216 RepID=UPI003CF5299C